MPNLEEIFYQYILMVKAVSGLMALSRYVIYYIFTVYIFKNR